MKIAFLFLLIDNPNFPKLWDKYFNGNEEKYNIYIHTKYPNKHTWKPKNIIPNIEETEWGFVTRAYIALFKEAYKNKENMKFILISESCLPIKKFDKFYNAAIEDLNISWIKRMKITRYDLEGRIIKHINEIKESNKKIIIPNINDIIKNYARFCLRREDINKILIAEKEGRMEFFNTMHVGDEFFLSVIAPLNKNNYINFEVTYDDWDYTHDIIKKINKEIEKLYILIDNKKTNEKDKKKYLYKIKELQTLKTIEAGHPKVITDINEDLKNILNVKSYFYRKFSKNSNIEKYWNYIVNKN
jgi:hypothetical protein